MCSANTYLFRTIDGFALTVDSATLLNDHSLAPSSTDRAIVDRWRSLKLNWALLFGLVQTRVVFAYRLSTAQARQPTAQRYEPVCVTVDLSRILQLSDGGWIWGTWPDSGEPLGGTEGRLEAVSFKKAAENMGRGRVTNARWGVSSRLRGLQH